MPQLNHTLYYSTILWSFFFVFGFLYFCVFFILFPLVRTYKLVKLYQFFSNCIRNIYLLSFFFYSFFYLKNLYFFQFLCNNFRLFFFNIYRLLKDKYYICELFFIKMFYYSTFLTKRSLLFSTKSFFLFFFLDVPSSDKYFFQDPATPVMEGIINFHHDLLAIQIFIAIFVLWMLVRILVRFRHKIHPDSQDFVNKRETEYLTYIEESAKLKSFERLVVECSQRFSALKGPLSWKDYLGFNALRDRRLFMGIIRHLTEEDFKKFTLIVKKEEFSDLAVAVGRCFLIKSLYFNYLLIRISCFYYERGFITLEYRRAYRHNLREFYKVAHKVYVEFLGPALERSMEKYSQGSYVFADKDTINKYDLGLQTRSHDHVHHHTLLEVVWTVIPTFILVYIAIPSFALLYAMDEIVAPVITVKVIGNQWYWRYELAVMKDIHYGFSDYKTFYKFNSWSKGPMESDLNFLPIQSFFLDRLSTLFRYFIEMFVVNKKDIQGHFFNKHFFKYTDFSDTLFKDFNYSLVDGDIVFGEGGLELNEAFAPIFGQGRYKYTFAGIETGLQKALELIQKVGHSSNQSEGQPVSSYLSSHGMVGIYILRIADILLENSLKNSDFLLKDYDYSLEAMFYCPGYHSGDFILKSSSSFYDYFTILEDDYLGGVKNTLNSNMVLLLSLKKKKKFLLALIGKEGFYEKFQEGFSVFVGDPKEEARMYGLKNYFLSTFFDLKSNSLKVGVERFATLFDYYAESKFNAKTSDNYKSLSNFILQTRLEQTLQRDFLMKIIDSNNKFSTFVNRAGKITYEARLVGKEDFNWFMIPNKVGLYRLLDTDNALLLPEKLSIRILVTATDVLHSWSVPSLGIKIDACPGRLNQVGLYLKRIGTFYGQCSEICGIHHAFMPIVVKSVHYSDYYNYKLTFLLKAFKRFLKWSV